METNELIRSLSADLAPAPYRPLTRRSVGLAFCCLATAGMGSLLLGVRADITQQVSSPLFWFQSIAALLTFCVSGAMAMAMSVPGNVTSLRRAMWILGLVAGAFIGSFVASLVRDWQMTGALISSQQLGLQCALTAIALAVVPAVCIFTAVRKQAPTDPLFNALAAILAALAIGSLGLSLHCPADEGLHLFLWHGLPVLVLSLPIAFMTRRLLANW